MNFKIDFYFHKKYITNFVFNTHSIIFLFIRRSSFTWLRSYICNICLVIHIWFLTASHNIPRSCCLLGLLAVSHYVMGAFVIFGISIIFSFFIWWSWLLNITIIFLIVFVWSRLFLIFCNICCLLTIIYTIILLLDFICIINVRWFISSAVSIISCSSINDFRFSISFCFNETQVSIIQII